MGIPFLATAQKMGNNFRIGVPRNQVRNLGIQPRDELIVTIERTGKTVPIIRTDLAKKVDSYTE